MHPTMRPIGKVSNFFVLGLPRSRTAWLANFLTYDNHFCYHEAANGCHTIAQYREKLGDDGDSCTNMMLLNINDLYPDAPKLIIENDPKHAIEFCYKTYGFYNPQIIYLLQDKLDEVEGLRIKFDDIDNQLEGIWQHLIGTGYSKKRADMLAKLNIQVQDPYDIDIEATNSLFSISKA